MIVLSLELNTNPSNTKFGKVIQFIKASLCSLYTFECKQKNYFQPSKSNILLLKTLYIAFLQVQFSSQVHFVTFSGLLNLPIITFVILCPVQGVLFGDEYSGVWMIHSVPHFPPYPETSYGYPHTGHRYCFLHILKLVMIRLKYTS